MSSKITLEALETLDAIDRKGSFAAAAAALYRVPSAVTYTVQKLEEDLGVVLFRKEGRRSVLTPAGQVLLDEGRTLLTEAERLVETTRQVHSGWESCLNIGIDSIVDFNSIYPLLCDFYTQKPDIEVNLYEEVLNGAWESVIEGRVDLIIGAPDPEGKTQGLKYKEYMEIDWVFAVSSGHPLCDLNKKLTEDDISQYRAVIVRDTSRELPALTRRVFDKQAALKVPTLTQKIDAQKSGIGVGFLPKHRIANELKDGALIELKLEKEILPTSKLYVAWKTNNKGKAMRWFLDRVCEG